MQSFAFEPMFLSSSLFILYTQHNQRESESIPGARLSCFIVSCVYTHVRVVEMSMSFKLECFYILVSHFKINVSFSIMQNLNFQWGNLREVSGNFRIFKFRLTDIIYLFICIGLV